MKFISNCQADTNKIGQELAKKLKPGSIITLTGELGTGKTTITKAIAKALGIEQEITSPTFTLMNIYEIKLQPTTINSLIHVDTYRLENEEDLIEIGIEDYLGQDKTITIIEWPEKLNTLLKNKKTIDITIQHLGGDERKIIINQK